jgi:hypothetical protein
MRGDNWQLDLLGQFSMSKLDGDAEYESQYTEWATPPRGPDMEVVYAEQCQEEGEYEAELFEVMLAVILTVTPTEWLAVYGGPFVQFIGSHLDVRMSRERCRDTCCRDIEWGEWSEWCETGWHQNDAIEEDAVAGGVAGLQINLTEDVSIGGEFGLTSAAEMASGFLQWAF